MWCRQRLRCSLTVSALACAVLLAADGASAQGEPQLEPCSGGGYNPTPTAVEITAVPIVVTSTTADYFVLYVTHDVDGDTSVEIPVLVKRGEAGTTTLAENVEALPKERYRVEKYLVADPGDVDGDCIDDITELGDPVGMNPVNPAAAVPLSDGAVAVPDQETREMISTRSNARRYLKFVLFDMDTDAPGVYFMNTETHPGHAAFLDFISLEWNQDGLITGQIIYHPELVAPDGSPGVYTFYWDSVRVGRREKNEPDGSWVYQSYHFSLVTRSYTVLAASMPLLDDNLAFYNTKLRSSVSPDRLAVIQRIPHSTRVRRRYLRGNQLPGVEPGGRVRLAADHGPGRASPPPRHRDLRGAAQRAAPRRRHHHHRTPDAAVARQPARRARRHSQRLYQRRARQARHRRSHRRLCAVRSD